VKDSVLITINLSNGNTVLTLHYGYLHHIALPNHLVWLNNLSEMFT